jgi:glycosyltransferase involved in cell wall biosynthesis
VTILMVHNYYRRENPSGENIAFELEATLLRRYGHRVLEYTRSSDEIARYSAGRKARLPLDSVWSTGTLRALRGLIAASKPQLAHFQNTFPLISPSAYRACRDFGLPVVQTLHNYRLFCPGAAFFRDGGVCEDCFGKTPPWPGVVHGCYRGSRAATAVVATMLTVHRVLSTWTDMVDLYIAPTEFARQKLIQGGLRAEQIVAKPYFVAPDPGPGRHRGGYALFVGRLAPEKGIDTLLACWERLGGRVPLKIAGDGPVADRVADAAGRVPGVEWLGRKPLDEVYDLLGEAAVLIFPSEWYETLGRVAIEAYAKGTPVIAARIGAIAEVVEHGRTGLLFEPGDPESLAACVEWAWTHRREMAKIGEEARREYQAKYGPEGNYRRLMEIYALATARARGRR